MADDRRHGRHRSPTEETHTELDAVASVSLQQTEKEVLQVPRRARRDAETGSSSQTHAETHPMPGINAQRTG